MARRSCNLFFSTDQELVQHIDLDSFLSLTDHSGMSIHVNYKLDKKTVKEETFLLDSARRLRKLDFRKAPWQDISRSLRDIDWSPMKGLAMISPTVAHSWLLLQVIPILERLVPTRKQIRGSRNKLCRKRKLLWRKLAKIKDKLRKSTSAHKIAKLLQDKLELENELKTMYTTFTQETEARVLAGMREDRNLFFEYAKKRQKTSAKVGPFLDQTTGELNLSPDYTAETLSSQYSSVFTHPRPDWVIGDMEEFFRVDNSAPTGPILADMDFCERDIGYACSELSTSIAAVPDGIPSALLKHCRKELKRPLFILWRASLSK